MAKSQGLDGFVEEFYKSYWTALALSKFFIIMLIFLHLKPSSLLPKNKNPSLVIHFKPIALSNVNYHILAKVLANRP